MTRSFNRNSGLAILTFAFFLFFITDSYGECWVSPMGSYGSTCIDCHTKTLGKPHDEKCVLFCTCKRPDGGLQYSQLTYAANKGNTCVDISNQDGLLQCNKWQSN